MKNYLKSHKEINLDDIVFENRNKEYGAYALRNEEGIFLKKALFFGGSLAITLVCIPTLVNVLTKGPMAPESDPVIPPNWVYDIPIEKPNEPAPIKTTAPKSQPTETFVADVPSPSREVQIETSAPSIQKYESSTPGLTESKGEPGTVPTGKENTIGSSVPVISNEKTTPVNNDPVAEVDVKADFIGGINAFRAMVGDKFDASSFDGSGDKMTAIVTFIVERNGSISNVKATGSSSEFNNEAIKAVKAAGGKWQPAKVQNVTVRSYFKIPITIQFE